MGGVPRLRWFRSRRNWRMPLNRQAAPLRVRQNNWAIRRQERSDRWMPSSVLFATRDHAGSSATAKASVPTAVKVSPTFTRLSAACRRGSVTVRVCTNPPEGSTSEMV